MVTPKTLIEVYPLKLKSCLKTLLVHKLLLTKFVEEKVGKIDVLASKVDSLALDIDLLKKVMPNDVKENKTFATANAIQAKIDNNIRMLAELHADDP